MPNAINRRAALGRIAGAALVLPTAAIAAVPEQADADLLALQPAIDVADRELEAALDALSVAEQKKYALRPKRPISPGLDSASKDVIEECTRRLAEIRASGQVPELRAYDEALRRWEEDCARLEEESGCDAAHAIEQAAGDAVGQLRDLIAETPAKTLAGLIFKAKYAESQDYEQDVMTSIIDDLLRMAAEV